MDVLGNVVACTPIASSSWSVTYHLAEWVAEQRRKGLRWLTQISNSVAYGRNVLVDRVLKECPEASHIYFCDADVAPVRSDHPVIEQLLARDKDVICPLVPQYSLCNGIPLINTVTCPIDREPAFGLAVFNELPAEPFECRVIGGGALLIRTSVFRALPWPWFRWVFERGNVLWPEDFYFSQHARTHGFELWCDPRVVVEHIRVSPLGHAYDGALNAASVPVARQQEIFIDGDAPEGDYAEEIAELRDALGGA